MTSSRTENISNYHMYIQIIYKLTVDSEIFLNMLHSLDGDIGEKKPKRNNSLIEK